VYDTIFRRVDTLLVCDSASPNFSRVNECTLIFHSSRLNKIAQFTTLHETRDNDSQTAVTKKSENASPPRSRGNGHAYTEGQATVIKGSPHRARGFSKNLIVLALIILFVIVVRVRLSDVPLERDEGEYAYMGQLMLQGVPPYSEAYNMKLPGTPLMYALIMSVFGQTTQGIHLGFMVVSCVTILLIFLLAKKLMSGPAALAASGTYAVLSLSASVLGSAAHATHFVVLAALGGILVLLSALEKKTLKAYLGSGVLFGLAFLMKQPGLFFFLFGAAYILYHSFSSRPLQSFKRLVLNLVIFSVGAAVPLLVLVVWIYTAGTFDKFWFWTVKYASAYGSQVPISLAFDVFKSSFSTVAGSFFLFWILAVFGFIVVFFWNGLKTHKVFILLFALFSFLSICPGFYFREHYFVTLLPAVSILVGVFIEFLNSRRFLFLKPQYAYLIGSGIFIVAALTGILGQKEYLFTGDPIQLSRALYGANPFPESMEIAKFIESRSNSNDRIAVFGSEPQIFFYSKRRSATGYIYTYSLMEQHDYSLTMQKEMIQEVETSKPKFIVLVNVDASWLIQQESEKYILDWLDAYVKEKYFLVGVADIISPDLTVYKWHDAAKNYAVRSPAHVLILERS